MRLMEVGVVLLKSCQKVEELSKVKKPQRPEKSQRLLVWKIVYQSNNPPSIHRYKKFEFISELQ